MCQVFSNHHKPVHIHRRIHIPKSYFETFTAKSYIKLYDLGALNGPLKIDFLVALIVPLNPVYGALFALPEGLSRYG